MSSFWKVWIYQRIYQFVFVKSFQIFASKNSETNNFSYQIPVGFTEIPPEIKVNNKQQKKR